MASLFFLVKFLSGEIIMVIEQMAQHVWDWSPVLPNPNAQGMLWIPCHYLPPPKMSYAGEVCNSEHGCRSHPNYFRLHIDAERCMWKTNLETKFLPLVRRGLNRQTNTCTCQSEWDQWLNENHTEILTLHPTQTIDFVVSFFGILPGLRLEYIDLHLWLIQSRDK